MSNNVSNNKTNKESKKVLIVGLGISGISSAIALKKAGWDPVIIEKASERRKGGYFLALFGLGRYAAQDLGALQFLHDRRSSTSVNFSIDRNGITGYTLGFADIPRSFAPWMMLRGDIENAVYKALPNDIEILFDTVPDTIWQNSSEVSVTTKNLKTNMRSENSYDLVIGADGVFSKVRELAFGPHEQYIKELDYMICAYQLTENPPDLKIDQGVILHEVNKSFTIFTFKDHPATILFTYKADNPQAERKKEPRERIREVFGKPYGKYMEFALEQLDQADNVIFSTTDQVKMPSWHRGRVVLVGDSAWCPTLYSGMGATLGLGGANLLGKALQKHSDNIEYALNEWESILRPKVKQFQKQGATTGRRNFVSINEEEVLNREKSVKLRRTLMKSNLLGNLLKYTPSIKARNADLTKEL
ncbi:FAD-dependent monooxygenase [Staphylococcus sp. GDY8P57P]|uniref:FAD-dependent monooxygenase n=1 Tax=Staphylococcus sp. GDY8P57P TaxID=2804128 RepID=UPI00187DDE80|nr:FAD-dependent monooxygenase [Staphylococcus sp. GDY8P57P]MBF2756375.1 FAD-dependent monooxygenase [Staphylococcus haemolyticus]MBF2773622.1 FAD-dependent monooxygenase [Staphylococcus haemolyticus]MBF2775739.1 FAD-dependent monooxygenase [Staphylococcus haemolyticus]MBF2816656.1 FAD-dependent monooxygenase [Staphylococcus haemolyticus]MBF9719919.1 FAD-dependent monooxygenase [Staphylococcus haemolyticus]